MKLMSWFELSAFAALASLRENVLALPGIFTQTQKEAKTQRNPNENNSGRF